MRAAVPPLSPLLSSLQIRSTLSQLSLAIATVMKKRRESPSGQGLGNCGRGRHRRRFVAGARRAKSLLVTSR